jgi:hypothetical protein
MHTKWDRQDRTWAPRRSPGGERLPRGKLGLDFYFFRARLAERSVRGIDEGQDG